MRSDDFVKSRHSGESRIRSGAGTGVHWVCNCPKELDSGFRRNDRKRPFLTFCEGIKLDEFVKSRQGRRHSEKLQMQGARILRNEAYIEVRRNDER